MNVVNLIGRLTRDPEVKQTESGIKYAFLTLAIDRNFKKDDKEQETDFIPIIAWRHQAEFLENYIRKGAKLSVEGRFESSQYEKDGEKKTSYKVVANRVQSLDSKAQNETRLGNAPAQQAASTPAGNTQAPATQDPPWEMDL